MIDVRIHSRAEAESLSEVEKENSSMISIQAPDKSKSDVDAEDFGGRLLRLYFHDAEHADDRFVIFDQGHARKVLGFVSRSVPTEDEDHTLHVHCLAGQSRSAGVALALTEILSDGEVKPTNKWQNYNHHVYSVLVETAIDQGKYDPF